MNTTDIYTPITGYMFSIQRKRGESDTFRNILSGSPRKTPITISKISTYLVLTKVLLGVKNDSWLALNQFQSNSV